MALLWVTLPNGLALSPDSVTYLRAADDLAHLRAPTNVIGEPLDLWPPLYPAALAVVIAATPLEPTAAARLLAALLMPVTAALTTALAVRCGASARWALASGALALVGAGLVVASSALSEQLFGVFVLATLLALVAVDDDRLARAAAAGVLAGAAVLTRTLGIVLVAAGAASLLLARCRRAALVFTAVAVLGPIGWVIRNLVVFDEIMPTVDRSRSLGTTVVDLLRGVGQLLAPSPGLSGVDVLAGVAGVALVGVLVVRSWSRPATRPVALFVVLFPAALVVAETRVGLDPISNRLLAPVWAPLLVLGAVELSRHALARWAYAFAAAWVLLLGLFCVDRVLDLTGDGVGFSAEAWDDSAVVASVRDLDPDTIVISNSPWALAFRSDRPARRPRRYEPSAGDVVVVAWFRDPDRTGDDEATDPATVARATGYELGPPTPVDDGVLYEVRG